MAEKVICVTGPTACGKTRLGILLARQYGGEIISCDSMQLYRGMEIGTAAPTAEERALAVHHMVGVAAPDEAYSAARFVHEADACVQDCLARGRVPILVGGTGLYMDSLVRGGGFAAGCSGGKIRAGLTARLERKGIAPLFDELRAVDPDAAARLHISDEKRILRALEVYLETGETLTAHNERTRTTPPKYDATYIALSFADREELRRRIDLRVDKMVEAGLLEEVRTLLRSGVPREATAMQAIGFKEFLAVSDGTMTEREAVETVKLRSRQYAKRQLTWLRKNKSVHWFFWEKECDFQAALQFSTKILSAEGLS